MAAPPARPTAAELVTARDIIARAKTVDPRIRSADELLVCAAVACRAGEFNGVPTHCAKAMGKTISRPKSVTDWVARIEQLDTLAPVAAQQPEAQQPEPPLPKEPLRMDLFISHRWIEVHCPGLIDIDAGTVAAVDEVHALRTVSARVAELDEVQRGEIVYDGCPERETEAERQRRHDRNRKREEAAFLALDSAAADALRAKKAEQKRQQRQGEEETIRRVLESMVQKLERQAVVDSQRWRCPGGCKPGSTTCARAAFRRRCLPSRDYMAELMLWTPSERIMFIAPSGYAYGRLQQFLNTLRDAGEHESGQISEEIYQEQCTDFLACWDGIGSPVDFWRLSHTPGETRTEYLSHTKDYRTRNDAPNDPRPMLPEHPYDRFGDLRPAVGPVACARRGCSGCCYCQGQSLPVYLQVGIFRHGWHHSSKKPSTTIEWSRVDKIRFCSGSGSVHVLPGDIREHVSAEQLVAWQRSITDQNDMLLICRCASRELVLDQNEIAAKDAFLKRSWDRLEESARQDRERREQEGRAKHAAKRQERPSDKDALAPWQEQKKALELRGTQRALALARAGKYTGGVGSTLPHSAPCSCSWCAMAREPTPPVNGYARIRGES